MPGVVEGVRVRTAVGDGVASLALWNPEKALVYVRGVLVGWVTAGTVWMYFGSGDTYAKSVYEALKSNNYDVQIG